MQQDENTRSVTPGQSASAQPVSPERRDFFAKAAGLTAFSLAGGAAGLSALLAPTPAAAAEVGPVSGPRRRALAYEVRQRAAITQHQLPLPAHPTNGDEEFYLSQIGSCTKALPHDTLGEVEPAAYQALVNALASADPAAFDAIPLGGTVKLANPQAAYAFSLEGPDSHHLGMRAAPAYASAETAGELAEVYWRALARDVPFAAYGNDASIAAAALDLSGLSDFRGPKQAGVVTPATLFRGNTPGDLEGPYVSQFLFKDVPYGATSMPQSYGVPVAGDDFMTDYAEWLAVQDGVAPVRSISFDAGPRYIRNGRDLGDWVHRDFPYQGFLNAALILLGFGPGALDPANPYRGAVTQGGFVTFGAAEVLDLVARVARQALKAAWYQKWLVHRRVRPEAYAGTVHNHLIGAATYPIHADLLSSTVLGALWAQNGTYLLPMAYPEGSPTHPAYPAGHATIAGACATVLKAWFDEDFVILDPVEASMDGLALEPITDQLSVGGELNKLAANISYGRDFAGVHWRSDGVEGMRLGEQVAIGMLADYRQTYNEDFGGFALTRFDGTTVIIGA